MPAKSKDAAPADAKTGAPTYEDYEAATQPVFEYVKQVVVPRILAEERRRAGDPSASPKDYVCLCPLSVADRLPVCHNNKPGCRFSHRQPPPGPRYGNDPVRHALFQREARSLLARFPEMDDVEFRRMVDRIFDFWGQQRKRSKKTEAKRAEADNQAT